MANITLKQLRYFEALARHGHFGRAAAASSISQPALSVQIKDLEEALGAKLFERSARKVHRTHVGDAFIARVPEILRAVEELEDIARASRDDVSGRLRIGLIPTLAPYLLPTLLDHMAEAHPGVELGLRETEGQRLLAELRAGRLDAALVSLPVADPHLTEAALFDEEILLVRPFADADAPVPDLRAVADMNLLLLEQGQEFRDEALALCGVKGAMPGERLDASAPSTLVHMVAAGMGVTLLPELAVAAETRGAQVDAVRFGPPRPTRQIGLVWRKESPLSDQLLRLSQTVQSALKEARDRREDRKVTP